ncbi:MAG: hypothetical protein AAFR75_02055 [Pseudomonadota bacterium]
MIKTMLAVTLASALVGLNGTLLPASAEAYGLQVAKAHGCVAVAKRKRGVGARVPHTRNARYGYNKPCVRAMRACRADLATRKRRGLNPVAACVVVRRGWI